MARRKGLRLNRTQILEGYMVMGGIPFYWDRLQKGESIAQGIDRLFVSRDAEFADEFDRLYVSLFKKPGIYVAVVTALAVRRCGKTRDELIAELNVEDNGAFSKVLRELEYSKGRYAISPDYAKRLVERAQTFADKVSSGKAVFTTMVTPAGIRQDENSSAVQSEITAEDLFAD